MQTTTNPTAKARHYQRRIDAALRRSRMARYSCLSDKARELRAVRSRAPHELADWFGWNGELIRSELRSWGAGS